MASQEITTQDTLGQLEDLTRNLWWSWTPEVLELFRTLDPEGLRRGRDNPLVALRNPEAAVLADPAFRERVDGVHAEFVRNVDAPTDATAPRVAYFCMEYAIHESLPLYAGGLGVLAGDHLKAASDLGIPFTAVGLFLRNGYFEQTFDGEGRQESRHRPLPVDDLPLERVVTPTGEPVRVSVHIGDTEIRLGAWRVAVGRATLYLLDADVEGTPDHFRTLTHQLYQGGYEARIQKEVVLGIGGVRLLRALGVEPDVYHLNEGHCAFLTLELLREHLAAGMSRSDAESRVRARTVFTTHTPVPAGHDRFDPGLFGSTMGRFADELGLPVSEVMKYGRIDPGSPDEPFNMTVLGIRMSRATNGVSRLHGEVSRGMWKELWPGATGEEVPIGHVTNGVHLPTWTDPVASDFIERHLGDWRSKQSDPEFWSRIHGLSDQEVWALRGELRRRFVEYVGHRVATQTLPQEADLDPEALTIGFARRFATYKRAPLLFRDPEAAIRLLSDPDRPVQIVFAGKAHPADEGGKDYIQEIYRMSRRPEVRGRIVFLEDYDMAVGRAMVAGCDVWLNNPRRPMEASGTSGQKVAMHGGLNVAILDGWWPEGFNGRNGWAIGPDETPGDLPTAEQDELDAERLRDTLRNEVIPAFYERNGNGVPVEWVARIKEAMATLPHRFSTHRMVWDYRTQVYEATGNGTPSGR